MAAAPHDSVAALDVIPLVISGLALAVSGFVAWRTDRRATRAEKNVRDLATSSLWSDAIEATIRVMSHPTRDDATDRFQTLGVRLALSNNLRHLRNIGFDEKTIKGLVSHSTEAGRSLRERYGWPEPGSDSSLRPME